MKRVPTLLLALALIALSAACYHQVAKPATPEETTNRMAGWPATVQGVVLSSGRTVELPASADVTVEGDSLILKREESVPGSVWVDTVRMAEVSHVLVREINTSRTVTAIVVVPLAVVGVALVIAAMMEEDEPPPPPETSCPFIYAFDGNAYLAVAEPLGGAISAGLQRTDLSQMEGLALVDGEYHLVIANEMREVQYLDAFSLLAADHPEGTTVIADREGNLHVAAALVAPLRAVSAAGDDMLTAVSEHDHQWWSPASSLAPFHGGQARDTITLTFPRPAQREARLILHARTSQLGAHALKVMLDLWGDEVEHWYGLLDGSPAARAAHQEWVQREELWTLRVWVREADGWAPQNAAVGGGPYLSELQAISLDLSRVEGETVELRLHPPRGYWDIDFASLDTTRAAAPILTELHIAAADSLDGQDSRALLRDADGAPLIMSERGQSIGVLFAASAPAPGMTRTLFSRSTGYYRLETDRTGPRQAAQLDSLWLQPGYAVKLAEQFHEGRQRHALR